MIIAHYSLVHTTMALLGRFTVSDIVFYTALDPHTVYEVINDHHELLEQVGERPDGLEYRLGDLSTSHIGIWALLSARSLSDLSHAKTTTALETQFLLDCVAAWACSLIVPPLGMDRLLLLDSYTLRDGCGGMHVFGGIGSGKTSGSSQILAGAYLCAGMGGLVTTVKPEEIESWRRYMTEHGRGNSLIIFDETEGFNSSGLYRMETGNAVTTNTAALFTGVHARAHIGGTSINGGLYSTATSSTVGINNTRAWFGSTVERRPQQEICSPPGIGINKLSCSGRVLASASVN